MKISVFAVTLAVAAACTGSKSQTVEKCKNTVADSAKVSVVYFTKNITPEGLMSVYQALNKQLTGSVAVKISTGEAGNHHYLSPDLIKNLVQSLNGTIVECNTAYGGSRGATAEHRKVAEDHGFTAIANVDIMDENGFVALPFPKGKHIQEDFVGANFKNYDSWLILSHFKGHQMGGFGGALKNMSIGIASSEGKAWIHSAGRAKTFPIKDWGLASQNEFLESMAEAAGAVMNSIGDNAAYVNVMNHLSVDCDCNGNPTPPEMDDIGILASLDPVALDKACVDLIYSSDTQRSRTIRERIESRNAVQILIYAEELGLGGQKYKLVEIK
jgi:uncharacterized Fe-S center protein